MMRGFKRCSFSYSALGMDTTQMHPLSESFRERWARKERECELGHIAAKMIACGTDLLPDSAAPYLNFKDAKRQAPLWDVFADPTYWSQADKERLAPYRVIGSDGAGNPICINQSTGAVELLDHEDRFHTRQFVNTSIRQLADCLLAYMGEHDRERFCSAVTLIDTAALVEGAFWWYEAADLGVST
jgi:hypothetical protein